ncbi:ice-binding family protein [Streptomyces sp. E11-3]|uniref:ice-binding family protein n=1 Tax=Streptomyces sp. E11-3 TaxID=3110112 RepID=UPI00398087B8
MRLDTADVSHRRTMTAWIAGVLTLLVAVAVVAVTPTRASAVATEVELGTAESFAVLGGSAVTNTGPSVINGDLGVSPESSVTGFPPGIVNGATHVTDAVADQAQSDLTTAYNDAAGQAPDVVFPDDPPVELGGRTLAPGVYNAPVSAAITGTLTLDADNDPDAVWVFQVGSTLTTASASDVSLINGASPCNVFWQIGSSATLGTGSTFVGTIMALASVSVTTGTNIEGRALARNGAVTLDTNVITRPLCEGDTTTTGDDAATTGDDAATTGDDAAATGDDAAATGDDAAAATGDDAAATGDDAAATGDDAAAATGDDAAAATGDDAAAATGDDAAAATGDDAAAATGDDAAAATGDDAAAATGDDAAAATGDDAAAATGDHTGGYGDDHDHPGKPDKPRPYGVKPQGNKVHTHH